jgi:hypothetical protein
VSETPLTTAVKTLIESGHLLPAKDQEFVKSLISQYDTKGLSEKQAYWAAKMAKEATRLATGVEEAKLTVDVGSFVGITGLFKEVAKHLKYPALMLQLPDGRPIRLKMSGSGGKAPGTVNITDGRPFGENIWYGRVDPGGQWAPSKTVDPRTLGQLATLLKKLSADPVNTAAEYGKLVGRCCFCGSPLTDDKSVSVGYGPVCAKHWGLPWNAK